MKWTDADPPTAAAGPLTERIVRSGGGAAVAIWYSPTTVGRALSTIPGRVCK